MLLVDKKATENSKSSLFLTKEEFKELYPNKVNSRINYIFAHAQPQEVITGEAKLLMKKYPHLIKWGKNLDEKPTARVKELQEMKYGDLKTLGAKVGLNFRELGCTKPILIDRILEKEKE